MIQTQLSCRHHQSFRVAFDYPVIFTRDLFRPSHPLLAKTMDRLKEKRRHRAAVFIDAGVVKKHPSLVSQIRSCFDEHPGRLELVMPPRILPGGETVKNNFPMVLKIIRSLLEHRLCRHSYVVAVGGGAVLDAVGFAASLTHRGLRLVRVPTTVLSQCDGGVGVKTGVNLDGGKNSIGTFAPPFAVLNDFRFLSTLPDRDWAGGIAEAFKVSIIRDASFFEWLCRHAPSLGARNPSITESMIKRCAKLHLQHIQKSGDSFEHGRARPLDFGHWSAHKLETMSNYRISHGQAVGTGVALDSFYAAMKGWITGTEADAIYRGLRQSGLALWHDELERRNPGKSGLEILKGLDDFREHLGGELCVTFPKGIGKKFEAHKINLALFEKAVRRLKQLVSSAEW